MKNKVLSKLIYATTMLLVLSLFNALTYSETKSSDEPKNKKIIAVTNSGVDTFRYQVPSSSMGNEGNPALITLAHAIENQIETEVFAGSTRDTLNNNIPALQAHLARQNSAVFDQFGNLYIADRNNFKLRRVDAATGILSTIAGSGFINLSGDGGLAINAGGVFNSVVLDANSNIYCADDINDVVRRIDPQTGIITRVAGTGVGGHSGDGGQATQAKLKLDFPGNIVIDNSNNLYIAEPFVNRRVRKVNLTTGVISTIAGNGGSQYGGDGAIANQTSIDVRYIAVDSDNNLFIVDGEGEIRRVDSQTQMTSTVNFPKQPNDFVVSLVIDLSDNLIFSATQFIKKLNLSDNMVSTLTGSGFSGYFGDGKSALQAEYDQGSNLTLSLSGNVILCEYAFNNTVRTINANDEMELIAGRPPFSGDGGPAALATLHIDINDIEVDHNGNVFISDYFNNRIRRVDRLSNIIQTVLGNGRSDFEGADGLPATSASIGRLMPNDFAIDINENIFFIQERVYIRKVSANNNLLETIASVNRPSFVREGLNPRVFLSTFVQGIEVDNFGNLYVAQGGGAANPQNRVDIINLDTGNITRIAGGTEPGYSGDGGPAVEARFDFVNFNGGRASIKLDPFGNLIIADVNNHRVRELNLRTGIVTTIAGSGQPGFSGDGGPAPNAKLNKPDGLTFDTVGNLYIGDVVNHKIRKVDRDTGSISTVATVFTRTDVSLSAGGGLFLAADKFGNLYYHDFNYLDQVSVIRDISPEDTTAPVVHLDRPNGNEQLAADQEFEFTWHSSDNLKLAKHDLFLSIDGGFSFAHLKQLDSDSQSYRWQVPNTINTAGAIVKIAASDAARNYSTDKSDEAFTIGTPISGPSLLSPLNDTVGVTISPTLRWQSVSGAISYLLQVSIDSTLSTSALNKVEISNTEHTLSNLSDNTTYFWRVQASINSGISNWSEIWNFTTKTVTSVEQIADDSPNEFILNQNYPNPFNPNTLITFQIPTSEFVTLKIYNVLGEEVDTIVSQYLDVGIYRKQFNAGNFSNGLYLYTLQAGAFVKTRKMLLVR